MTPRIRRAAALAVAVVLSAVPSTLGAASGLRVGDPAPDFALRDQRGRLVRLADFRGRPVVLAFIVRSFTGG
jgi:peroxiredoxin Q/BCP